MSKELKLNQYKQVWGEDVRTPIMRLAFPAFVRPNVYNGKARYGCSLLFPKKDVGQFFKLTLAAETLMQFKYKKKDKFDVFCDGDEEKVAKYKGFPENFYIKCNNPGMPDLYDKTGEKVGPEAMLGGLLVRAVLTPLITETGVAWRLKGLAIVEDDGVRFTAGPDPKALLFDDEDESAAQAETPAESAPVVPAAVATKKKGISTVLDLK